MDNATSFVVFSLDDRRYGLPLDTVAGVYRAAAVTPLPDAPELIRGVINLQGRALPVLDLRKRFHLPSREPRLEDQFLRVTVSGQDAVLLVDRVLGVFAFAEQEITGAAGILVEGGYVQGVAVLAEGLIVISDLVRLLSSCEEPSGEGRE